MEVKGESKPFKVLMMCLPASGHMNPFVCYAKELAKNPNVKVIMYSSREFQKMIEGGNIEYRNFEMPLNKNPTLSELRKMTAINKIMNYYMSAYKAIFHELLRCVIEEEIDLIVYDFMTVYAKWLLRYLRVKYQRGELKRPPPKALMFAPSLLTEKGVYPNSFEESFFFKPLVTFEFLFNMVLLFAKYSYFCYKFELPIENPIRLAFMGKEEMNICCIIPEFQPRSHLYSSSYHFVGSCASEEVRGEKTFLEPLKSFLEQFPEINPLPLVDLRVPDSSINTEHKLIYISFGTVVNTEVWPFLRLIDAVKAANLIAPSFKYLMSTGDASCGKIHALIRTNELQIPENLLILPRVPQLDVLKRASLFVTHSGQGGTSEAIHYGVPMVCIPVMTDQPAVAYRAADELGLGVRLDFDDLQPHLVKNAILKVLNDKSYLERAILFSQISRKYHGTKEATKVTIEYLQRSAQRSSISN